MRTGRPTTGTSRRAGTTGFTLLEVMAAVGILALVYVVLAQGAMQGIVWEGDSRRRLEASMLADSVLAQLEAGWLATGAVPAMGETEEEEGDYIVRTTTLSWNPISGLGLQGFANGGRRNGRLGGPTADPTAALLDLLPGGSPMREVVVEVAWLEGEQEISVARRTYALDMVTLGPVLDAAGISGSQDGSSAGGGGNDDDDSGTRNESNGETRGLSEVVDPQS